MCGGIMGKCEDITDRYHEYIGGNKVIITVGEQAIEHEIVEWRRTIYGYGLVLKEGNLNGESSPSFYLNQINNGNTLYSGFFMPDLFDWTAVKLP
jgi:hypothetical protein